MKRTVGLTLLLVLGLLSSQFLPVLVNTLPNWYVFLREFITMGLLAYIMIEVGREFDLDRKNRHQYVVDYGVAMTAAAFPWILVSLYFYYFLPATPEALNPKWIEVLLVGRFAAPTSAGVLFTMLASAGLSDTWVYRKTRTLAIFDDLDTVLFMIPLQMLIVGFVWQLGMDMFAIGILILLAIKYFRKLKLPKSWPWVLFYAFFIVAFSKVVYLLTKDPETQIGMHIEILLPAFALGCMLKTRPNEDAPVPGEDQRGDGPEETAGLVISGAFMFLVGLSMPSLIETRSGESPMGLGHIAFHVLAVTILSNLGKMVACFCYKKDATFRQRLAVSISLFPRGEVGAGILALSLSYDISGAFMTVAFLSLALNLILTGFFIYAVKRLVVPN